MIKYIDTIIITIESMNNGYDILNRFDNILLIFYFEKKKYLRWIYYS